MIDRLIKFLTHAPVNFLAVDEVCRTLEDAGYTCIDPTLPLQGLQAGSKVYVTKNDSSVYAFRLGQKPIGEAGFRIICAHCDSPTFRIKPGPR